MIAELVDFASPDAFEEIKKRSAACLESGSSTICCETVNVDHVPEDPVSSTSTTIATTTIKTTTTSNTVVTKPFEQRIDFTSHKNYKLFNFTACGLESASANRISFGE